MAELAAGAYVAAEVVEHTAQAGYAAYVVSKPTLPLKVSFLRIATASDDASRRSLARSCHTVTVIGNKAYIFGGDTDAGTPASTDIHVVTLEHSAEPEMDYSLIPALSTFDKGNTPTARAKHAACAFHGNVAIYGGCDERGTLLDETSSLWLFSPDRKSWDRLAPANADVAPGPRQNAHLFAKEAHLILFGGIDGSGDHASDLWQFDVALRTWTPLPTAPVAASNAAWTKSHLWLVSGSDQLSSQIHYLDLSSPQEDMTWESVTLPTNPLIPGPRARREGALLPISTGYGRNYLVYLLGARNDNSATAITNPEDPSHSQEVTQFSDTWVLQVPSSDLEVKPALSFKDAIKPAKIKDAIRSALGADTGHLTWSEAVVQLPSDKELSEENGKLHPGPRAFFGADVMQTGSSVVFWGGMDAKGERVGDGWVAKFE